MDKRFCIFDMDGTLVDSMPIWKSLGRDYLEARGCRPTPAQLAAMGPMTMLEGARYMMDTFGVEGPPEHIIDEMHAVMEGHYRTDIPLKPGIEVYLDRLKGEGARLCVATATAEPLARACLERLGVVKYFDFILSCETVGAGKTRPDVYLEAARRLGGCPADTAVFEDALYAAQTAKEAGFYVVGIPEASYENDWPALEELADETILDWRKAL